MYSKRLSQRLSSYLGVTGKSAWGAKARELGIEVLNGHSPVITSALDFTETSVPNATALADTPLSWTVTSVGAVADNTIVANPYNGYLLITPGSAADTGYGLQALTTDVAPADILQLGGNNTTIATTFDRYWGARVAFSTSATWDGAVFMGLAASDTTPLFTSTGLLSETNCVGINIDNTGTISLAKSVTVTAAYVATTKTISQIARADTNYTAADFHDFFVWTHYASTTAGSAIHWQEAYFDGNLVAKQLNVTLPSLSSTVLVPSIAIYNGDAATCTMAVAEIVCGSTRYHLGA